MKVALTLILLLTQFGANATTIEAYMKKYDSEVLECQQKFVEAHKLLGKLSGSDEEREHKLQELKSKQQKARELRLELEMSNAQNILKMDQQKTREYREMGHCMISLEDYIKTFNADYWNRRESIYIYFTKYGLIVDLCDCGSDVCDFGIVYEKISTTTLKPSVVLHEDCSMKRNFLYTAKNGKEYGVYCIIWPVDNPYDSAFKHLEASSSRKLSTVCLGGFTD
jgi:hypothetical protein